MSLEISAAPTAEPISLVEAKAHLRVTATAEDTLITSLIVAARQHVESHIKRALIAQTWDWKLRGFPVYSGIPLELPKPPLLKINSVTYVDSNGDTQTWASSKYDVDLPAGAHAQPGKIEPAYNEVWPTTRERVNAVTVQFVAGYAAPASVTNADDTLTPSPQYFSNGDQVRIGNSGGDTIDDVPSGLAVNTDYFIVSAGTTVQLAATSGGAAISLADDGTGQHYLGKTQVPEAIIAAMLMLIEHWFDNRGPVVIGAIQARLDFAVDALLAPFTVTRF